MDNGIPVSVVVEGPPVVLYLVSSLYRMPLAPRNVVRLPALSVRIQRNMFQQACHEPGFFPFIFPAPPRTVMRAKVERSGFTVQAKETPLAPFLPRTAMS